MQLDSVIKLSPAARLPGSGSGGAGDVEAAPSVSVPNTDTQICTGCLRADGMATLPVVLQNIYWEILRGIFSS